MPTNPFDLSGQVALVTGGSRGLGAAMSIALAQAGADVVVHGIEPTDATEAAVTAIGRRAAGVIADISEKGAAQHVVDEAVRLLGKVDIVVNNAGLIRRTPAAQHSDEDWDAVVNINLSAVFRMCRAAGNHMLERGSGRIVNIASLLAFQGGINVPGYSAAKGGVAQLTKALANEWASKGITVNAIAPGYMSTDNTAALRADTARYNQILERIPAGRWGQPEDLGGAVVFLASNASAYVNGHVLVVDGGWMAR
ncbi:MAG: 2-dehydro-3-deoxy-D-gluconate 5-dehydrogenase KduD [Acidobacteria bacterium]|nr:2-dehydro-3-deoxy-D-gluconate 5-dehydrogenase KduD [Acidobacteriota bacterium]